MKNMRKRERKHFCIVFSVSLVFLIVTSIIPGVMGASPVDLGSSCNFVILAKTGISTTGTSTINGNIGVSPIAASAITGFGLTMDPSNQFSTSSQVTGRVYAADYASSTPAMMTSAISAMEAAYTDGSGRPPTSAAFVDVGAGNIGGMSLPPGIYTWSTGVIIPSNVILSGGPDDIWIFVIPGTLDISTGKEVVLSSGSQANNIFWVVADTTTLGTNSLFNGNILDQTMIRLQTGATLNGRALAQSAVTLDTAAVSGPATCGFPTPTPTPASTMMPTTTTTTTTINPVPIPEFPVLILPAIMIIGSIVVLVLYKKN